MNSQVLAIFATEAAERFNYYGLASLLALYLSQGRTSLSEHTAAAVFSVFTGLAYATPLMGSAMASTRLGMYGTIAVLSCVYLAGGVLLSISAALGERITVEAARVLVFVSLLLIATGTGGIKPNVAAFGALQVSTANGQHEEATTSAGERSDFEQHSTALTHHSTPNEMQGEDSQVKLTSVDEKPFLAKFFSMFYFVINVGSIFGQLLIPAAQKWYGYPLAFATSAAVLLSSIAIFIGGNTCTQGGYRHDGGNEDLADGSKDLNDESNPPMSFQTGLRLAIDSRFGFTPRRARAIHGDVLCEVWRRCAQTASLLVVVSLYWAAYAAMGALWVQQAAKLALPFGLSAAQWTALNPVTVLVALPLFEHIGRGYRAKPKVAVGIGLAAAAVWSSVAVQMSIDSAGAAVSADATEPLHTVNGLWSLPQWVALGASEPLASVVSLQLAYADAPEGRGYKSLLQSFWLLTCALGSVIAAVTVETLGDQGLSTVWQLSALAGLGTCGAVLFGAIAYCEPRTASNVAGSTLVGPETAETGRPSARYRRIPEDG